MVEFLWNPSLVATFVSAILLGLFSIIVGALAKFQGPARWYAIFGIGFAFSNAFGNIDEALGAAAAELLPHVPLPVFQVSIALNILQFLLQITWIIGAIGLMEAYGARPDRWVTFIFGIMGAVLILPALLAYQDLPEITQLPGYSSWIVVALSSFTLGTVAVAVTGAAGLVMARARLREFVPGQAILASAMTAYALSWPAWFAALSTPFRDPLVYVGLISLLSYIGLAAGWMKVRARSESREGMAVLLVASIFLVGSFILGLTIGFDFSPSSIARTFDVLLVGYAILRLQYLGLDIKVRWGLSKSTVAAVFVAVFFIASEVAQQFFGDRFNNNYVGIAAAGALVLAIAPLQRVADRIATAAIPVATPAGLRASAAEIYRKQVSDAWTDGRISPDERKMLRSLRLDLHLPIEEADRIEEKIEGGLSKRLD